MSLQFSDTTTKKGIIQEIESECGFNDGDISSNTTLLKKFTSKVNLAFDDFTKIAIQASGKYQFDDSNQTSYPIITANIVQGQRDYPFTTDSDGNLILDIYKVLILPSATATLFQPLDPIDAQSDDWNTIQTNYTGQGVPTAYDKTANGIFFDYIPSYSVANGIKIYINREASYFAYTDTTKKPGVPGILHRYFVVKGALDYARQKQLASYEGLVAEVLKYEGDEERGLVGSIARYYGKRAKDERSGITSKITPFI